MIGSALAAGSISSTSTDLLSSIFLILKEAAEHHEAVRRQLGRPAQAIELGIVDWRRP